MSLTNMRGALVLLVVSTQPTLAQDVSSQALKEAARSARMASLTAERVLYAADQALDASAVIVSALDNDRLIHEELKRIAAGVPGVRAIIVVGADGMLRHDSYRFPPDQINLSDREYVQTAQDTNGLAVGKTVIGRTSGASFVPLVKRNGSQTFVAVASPYALVDVKPECADCWSLTLTAKGALVSVFPPERKVSPELISAVANAKADGSQIMKYSQSAIAVSWIKSQRFGTISVAVRGLTDSASVNVDVY